MKKGGLLLSLVLCCCYNENVAAARFRNVARRKGHGKEKQDCFDGSIPID